MTGLEGWHNTERQNFGPGNQGEAAGLSRSVQSFYQPIERSQTAENLPSALDFGTGTDLYRSAAYTGGSLSARSFMTDEVEQKLEAPKIKAPSDATTEAGVISGQANQDRHAEAFKLAHLTDRTPSGIMPALHESFGIEGDLTAADLGIKPDQVLIAQGFKFPNPVDVYKKEFEHKYRGRELSTMDKEIPKEKWDEAYKAFPEMKQLGEKDATRLMKAIIANELEHYGAEDVTQDAVAKTGHGGAVANFSLGYEQIKPDGVRNMAKQFDAQVAAHQRVSNPLAKFEKMTDDQLAAAAADPKNAPILVAAHMALDLQTLNRHKNELRVTPEALGYFYNADCVYAKTDTKHEHLLVKKDADKKHIPNVPALPTENVLEQSEHAANIRKWLEKVH